MSAAEGPERATFEGDEEQTLPPVSSPGKWKLAQRGVVGGPDDREKMYRALQQAVFGSSVDEGNSSNDGAEQTRLREQCCGLLYPDTPIRSAYDMFQLVIILYLGWLLPRRVAFSTGAETSFEVAVDIFIDVTVWVDIVLQMKMYQYDHKTRKLITDRKFLKRQYIRSWFLVDVFAVLPLDQLLFAVGSLLLAYGTHENSVVWGYGLLEWSVTARLTRLLRLVRLGKIKQLFNTDQVIQSLHFWLRHLGVNKLQVEFYFRVAFLVVLILSGSHFLGCLWLHLGRTNVLERQNPMGWMVSAYSQDSIYKTKDFVSCIGGTFNDSRWNQKHGAACIDKYTCFPVPKENAYDVNCSWIKDRETELGGTGDDDGVGASASSQYLSAFYFALATIATVGYGDILPDTPGEKEFVILCITTGAFVYAYIIGDFSMLITNLSRDHSNYDAKMRSVNDLLAYIDAPVDLRTKVHQFYEFKYYNKEGPPDILNELPVALQTALIQARYGGLIEKVPFFSGCNERCAVDICKQMRSYTVSPGDNIMEAGEYNDELLILAKGVGRTTDKDPLTQTFSEFEVGSFFGELQFLGLEEKRTLTITAVTFSEIAAIAPEAIQAVLLANADLRQRLEAYGVMRKEIDDMIQSGEAFDMDELTAELEQRYQGETELNMTHGRTRSHASPPTDDRAILTAVQVLRSEHKLEMNQMMQNVDHMGERMDARMNEMADQMATMATSLDEAVQALLSATSKETARSHPVHELELE